MCCFGPTLVGATISSIVEHSALHLFFKFGKRRKTFSLIKTSQTESLSF